MNQTAHCPTHRTPTFEATQMGILTLRLLVITGTGLSSAIAIGLLASTHTMLAAGILVLGFGMILAILFYLLRPVPAVPLIDLPELPPAATPASARVAEVRPSRRVRERSSAEIIAFPAHLNRKPSHPEKFQ